MHLGSVALLIAPVPVVVVLDIVTLDHLLDPDDLPPFRAQHPVLRRTRQGADPVQPQA